MCQIDKTIDFDREWQNYLQYFEDFGLDDTYAYYSIPVAACNDYLLSQLEEYVTDGEINIEALNSGEQVLVIEHIDNLRKVKNAFEVGDKVNILTSVAVDEKQISELIYDRLAYLPQKPFLLIRWWEELLPLQIRKFQVSLSTHGIIPIKPRDSILSPHLKDTGHGVFHKRIMTRWV